MSSDQMNSSIQRSGEKVKEMGSLVNLAGSSNNGDSGKWKDPLVSIVKEGTTFEGIIEGRLSLKELAELAKSEYSVDDSQADQLVLKLLEQWNRIKDIGRSQIPETVAQKDLGKVKKGVRKKIGALSRARKDLKPKASDSSRSVDSNVGDGGTSGSLSSSSSNVNGASISSSSDNSSGSNSENEITNVEQGESENLFSKVKRSRGQLLSPVKEMQDLVRDRKKSTFGQSGNDVCSRTPAYVGLDGDEEVQDYMEDIEDQDDMWSKENTEDEDYQDEDLEVCREPRMFSKGQQLARKLISNELQYNEIKVRNIDTWDPFTSVIDKDQKKKLLGEIEKGEPFLPVPSTPADVLKGKGRGLWSRDLVLHRVMTDGNVVMKGILQTMAFSLDNKGEEAVGRLAKIFVVVSSMLT
jgi:hypothetical protein